MTRIRIALALAASLAACGEARDTTQADPDLATGTVCPQGNTLTYENFGRAFFGNAEGTEGYCNYCHASTEVGTWAFAGPPGFTWDDLAVIRARARDIDARAGKGPTPTVPQMPFIVPPEVSRPPGFPAQQPIPSDQERQSLSIWLACGAPP